MEKETPFSFIAKSFAIIFTLFWFHYFCTRFGAIFVFNLFFHFHIIKFFIEEFYENQWHEENNKHWDQHENEIIILKIGVRRGSNFHSGYLLGADIDNYFSLGRVDNLEFYLNQETSPIWKLLEALRVLCDFNEMENNLIPIPTGD